MSDVAELCFLGLDADRYEYGPGGTGNAVRVSDIECHINGTWKIVNKTFAHTGGQPPA